ncbi:MAG: sporulation protein YqfC [Clostridiales bacterium]|jgi:sporulation protein YqfC|nr:sporulation protein YqfC [Clostridiales bacterium]
MGIKKLFSSMFELPKEIILNLPLITLVGSEEMSVENYKNIIEYTEEKIRVNTSCGVIKIEGSKLSIKQITQEKLYVIGKITGVGYLY